MTTIPYSQLRGDQVRLGLWMFLGTVTMLFAAFASAYIIRRSGSDWHEVVLPRLLWWNTLVLAASSVTLEYAYRSGARRRWVAFTAAFAITTALGLGFLAGQIGAWQRMLTAGLYLQDNPHSSFFYMLTGAHGLHVMGALTVLAWGGIWTWRHSSVLHQHRWDTPGETQWETQWETTMSVCRTFWHYLGGIWLLLFALIVFF